MRSQWSCWSVLQSPEGWAGLANLLPKRLTEATHMVVGWRLQFPTTWISSPEELPWWELARRKQVKLESLLWSTCQISTRSLLLYCGSFQRTSTWFHWPILHGFRMLTAFIVVSFSPFFVLHVLTLLFSYFLELNAWFIYFQYFLWMKYWSLSFG